MKKPDLSIERRDSLRAASKPATEVLFDVDADMKQVLIVARGRLDLMDTVIALPIADAANLATALVGIGAAALGAAT